MTDTTSAIGLLGGTFDPIHNGHLHIARQAQKALKLHTIYFIPNKQSPQRPPSHTSAQHRRNMVALAVQEHPEFELDDSELSQPTPSYSLNTLKLLRQRYDQRPLYYLLGLDAFNHFNQWHKWQEIIDLTHVIVINRPHATLVQDAWMQQLLAQHETKKITDLQQCPGGLIFQLNITDSFVCATKIRQSLQKNRTTNPQLPEPVYQYILKHHLYSS